MKIRNYLKKSYYFNLLRNSLVNFPSSYLSPKVKKTSISDFFFYNTSQKFDSKISLFNLSSHVLPEIEQKEVVWFFIFDKNGKQIRNYKFDLEYQETKEIFISNIVKDGYGSFFAFHIFENFGDLLENNSYITERGYVAYKLKNSIWNYMHGNHNAAYLDNKFEIHSVIGSSINANNPYSPQVSFLDQDEFEIIINNPSHNNNLVKIKLKDNENKIIKNETLELNPFGTRIFKCKKKIDIVELNSKNILNRPIIIKYYKNNFDIFHG